MFLLLFFNDLNTSIDNSIMSFNPPDHLAKLNPHPRDEFITFDDLIHKYSIKLIDKLQIDIEGAEFKVMNSIDYDKIRINQIFF